MPYALAMPLYCRARARAILRARGVRAACALSAQHNCLCNLQTARMLTRRRSLTAVNCWCMAPGTRKSDGGCGCHRCCDKLCSVPSTNARLNVYCIHSLVKGLQGPISPYICVMKNQPQRARLIAETFHVYNNQYDS